MLCVTRAQVHERLQANSAQRVWTWADFFRQLGTWATFTSARQRDDGMARVLATLCAEDTSGALRRRRADASDVPSGEWRWSYASEDPGFLLSLRHAVHHECSGAVDGGDRGTAVDGTCRAAFFEQQELPRGVPDWVGALHRVDEQLSRSGVVDDLLALALAVRFLRQGRRPGFLRDIDVVQVDPLIFATSLQAAALVALSRQVRVVVAVPATGSASLRGAEGLHAAFDRACRAHDQPSPDQFHLRSLDVVGEGPLASLCQAMATDGVVADAPRPPVSVHVFAHESEESLFVAQRVAALVDKDRRTRVQVLVSHGALAARVVDDLRWRGVAARGPRLSLLQSPAARLVLNLLALRQESAPLDRLLAVLMHPARRGSLSFEEGARVGSTIARAVGPLDGILGMLTPGDYQSALDRLADDEPSKKSVIDFTRTHVLPLVAAITAMPLRAPLVQLMESLWAVALAVIDVQTGANTSFGRCLAQAAGDIGDDPLARGRDRVVAGSDATRGARPTALGGSEVLDALWQLRRSVDRADGALHVDEDGSRKTQRPSVDLARLQQLVELEFAAHPWKAVEQGLDDDECGVEVAALDEVDGRRFDHVFIVGAVGRSGVSRARMGSHQPGASLDAAGSDNPAMSLASGSWTSVFAGVVDAACDAEGGAWDSAALGAAAVLQAELAWSCALASVRCSAHVTSSFLRLSGVRQVPSEWTLAVVRAMSEAPVALLSAGAVGADDDVMRPPHSELHDRAAKWRSSPSKTERPRLAGEHGSSGQGRTRAPSGGEPTISPKVLSPAGSRPDGHADEEASLRRWRQMSEERTHWSLSKLSSSSSSSSSTIQPGTGAGSAVPESPAAFAFALHPQRARRLFASSLGARPEHPLTTRTLRDLAHCAVRGVAEDVFHLVQHHARADEAWLLSMNERSARAWSRFARDRRARAASQDTERENARLSSLVEEETRDLRVGQTPGRQILVDAVNAWLTWAMSQLAALEDQTRQVEGTSLALQSVQVGHGAMERAPTWASVAVTVAPGQTVFLGDQIDQVFEAAGRRVVVRISDLLSPLAPSDLRTSSTSPSRLSLLASLRLLEHHRKSAPHTVWQGRALSLLAPPLVLDENDELRLRDLVCKDDVEGGLGASVGRVILPVLQGTLSPSPGPACMTCRLHPVCRVGGGRT